MRLAAVRSIARIEAARCGSRTNVLAELLTTETDRAGQSVHTLTLPAAAAQWFFAAIPVGVARAPADAVHLRAVEPTAAER